MSEGIVFLVFVSKNNSPFILSCYVIGGDREEKTVKVNGCGRHNEEVKVVNASGEGQLQGLCFF